MATTPLVGFRVSFFLSVQEELLFGWSENFWSSLVSVNDMKTEIGVFAPLLDALHGRQTTLNYARLTKMPGFRQVEVMPLVPNFGAPNGTYADSDFAKSGLLMELTGANGQKVRQWIRATPDGVIDRGGRYNPASPNHLPRLQAMLTRLTTTSAGWRLRVQDPSTPKKPITGITQAGDVTVQAHGYAPLDKVRISGVKGLTQANGVWRIESVTTDTFKLAHWVTPAVPTPMTKSNALATLQQPVFTAIQSGKIVRASSHQTGHPFAQSTGRRRTRRT